MDLDFSRHNPNIDYPGSDSEPDPGIDSPPGRGSNIDDPQPVPPDKGQQPPVELPPDHPGIPDNQPDPPPMGDPKPKEPTRLV
jgi:hypothetical protein